MSKGEKKLSFRDAANDQKKKIEKGKKAFFENLSRDSYIKGYEEAGLGRETKPLSATLSPDAKHHLDNLLNEFVVLGENIFAAGKKTNANLFVIKKGSLRITIDVDIDNAEKEIKENE